MGSALAIGEGRLQIADRAIIADEQAEVIGVHQTIEVEIAGRVVAGSGKAAELP